MKLDAPILRLPSVGPVYANRLKKLEMETIEDLLLHIPSRYIDYPKKTIITKIAAGETATVQGRVEKLKNIYTSNGKKIQSGIISDKTGSLQIVWFNQPFLTRTIKVGERYSFSGKVDWFGREKSLISPDYELLSNNLNTLHTGRLVPIYPETARVSSRWLRGKIALALSLTSEWLIEILPSDILKGFNLMEFNQALNQIHFPDSLELAFRAKTRLAFNELLLSQVKSLFRKKNWQRLSISNKLLIDSNSITKFIKSLSFKLTNSQIRSIEEISSDLGKSSPMNRLLEGDVGSGKTVVAATAAFISFINGFQSVFMAPTQILASQHYNTLHQLFESFKIRLSLVTSPEIKKDIGRSDIYVGTHALLHKNVDFEKVALVVIDEQHRFGVEQRAHLIRKSKTGNIAPHILTMTATPIPRTAALTVYGDLNLSTLDELPEGRKPVTTWIVPPTKRQAAYGWIKEKIKKDKIQAYIICPLIEESVIETMKEVRSVTAEYEKIKKIFKGIKVGLLHGKQSSKVKSDVLNSFKDGRTQVLVSTPVVEVGIDVANATIMVVEGSERFGLAQLHQLRGRVGRSSKESFCLIFTESRSGSVLTRLNALKKSLSGFELAELDLKMRGPGEIFGKKQHGYLEFKIATLSDIDLIKKARSVAEKVLLNPEEFPKLIKNIDPENIVPN